MLWGCLWNVRYSLSLSPYPFTYPRAQDDCASQYVTESVERTDERRNGQSRDEYVNVFFPNCVRLHNIMWTPRYKNIHTADKYVGFNMTVWRRRLHAGKVVFEWFLDDPSTGIIVRVSYSARGKLGSLGERSEWFHPGMLCPR